MIIQGNEMASIHFPIDPNCWGEFRDSARQAARQIIEDSDANAGDTLRSDHSVLFRKLPDLEGNAAVLNPIWRGTNLPVCHQSLLVAAAAMDMRAAPSEALLNRVATRMMQEHGLPDSKRAAEFLLHEFVMHPPSGSSLQTPDAIAAHKDARYFFVEMVRWFFEGLIKCFQRKNNRSVWVYAFPDEVDGGQFVQAIVNRFLSPVRECGCILRCTGSESAQNIDLQEIDETHLTGNALRRFRLCDAHHRVGGWNPLDISFPDFVRRAVVGCEYGIQPRSLKKSMGWNVLRDHVEHEFDRDPVEWAALIVGDVLKRVCRCCGQTSTLPRCPTPDCHEGDFRGDQVVMPRKGYVAIFPRVNHIAHGHPGNGSKDNDDDDTDSGISDMHGESTASARAFFQDGGVRYGNNLPGGYVPVETKQCKKCNQAFLMRPRLGGVSDLLGLPEGGCSEPNGDSQIDLPHAWPQRPTHVLLLITSPPVYERAVWHFAANIARRDQPNSTSRAVLKLCDAFQTALEQFAATPSDRSATPKATAFSDTLSTAVACLAAGADASNAVIADRIARFKEDVWPSIKRALDDISEYRVY